MTNQLDIEDQVGTVHIVLVRDKKFEVPTDFPLSLREFIDNDILDTAISSALRYRGCGCVGGCGTGTCKTGPCGVFLNSLLTLCNYERLKALKRAARGA